MVISVISCLEPEALLQRLLQIELLLKRTREIRWGPRTMDIDILLYGSRRIDLPDLVVPHPRMFRRAFVLIPLMEIYPEQDISGRNLEDMIGQCDDREGVRRVNNFWG